MFQLRALFLVFYCCNLTDSSDYSASYEVPLTSLIAYNGRDESMSIQEEQSDSTEGIFFILCCLFCPYPTNKITQLSEKITVGSEQFGIEPEEAEHSFRTNQVFQGISVYFSSIVYQFIHN